MKKKVTISIVIIIVALIVWAGYELFVPRPVCCALPPTAEKMNEDKTLTKLINSWEVTQSKFSVKAGESGTYNAPDKVQFISADTVLVHYDDGLVDHISVLRFIGEEFVELKNVGIMNTMPQNQWKALFDMYGDTKYKVASLQSNDKGLYVETQKNIFVK